MTDYVEAVYTYLRTLGDVGDEVRTEIRPYLTKEFGLSHAEARRVRSRAMKELRARGMVERLNVRGPYVRILA